MAIFAAQPLHNSQAHNQRRPGNRTRHKSSLPEQTSSSTSHEPLPHTLRNPIAGPNIREFQYSLLDYHPFDGWYFYERLLIQNDWKTGQWPPGLVDWVLVRRVTAATELGELYVVREWLPYERYCDRIYQVTGRRSEQDLYVRLLHTAPVRLYVEVISKNAFWEKNWKTLMAHSGLYPDEESEQNPGSPGPNPDISDDPDTRGLSKQRSVPDSLRNPAYKLTRKARYARPPPKAPPDGSSGQPPPPPTLKSILKQPSTKGWYDNPKEARGLRNAAVNSRVTAGRVTDTPSGYTWAKEMSAHLTRASEPSGSGERSAPAHGPSSEAPAREERKKKPDKQPFIEDVEVDEAFTGTKKKLKNAKMVLEEVSGRSPV
ncbi:hypothetical protein BJ508DRAFT_313794 [Ascobolus immersus RN42]|uniref:Uncharacterized protein n=1 Tax=Ascobolus immersus RN42 TaxID=1160509 RepID=A0A3N4HNP1_ASCIM|nr:hypothetical protein BJ508DRAFT_313794 [Ascobolus immersus RN42]